jgi:M6 family metalloprotease-like protein
MKQTLRPQRLAYVLAAALLTLVLLLAPPLPAAPFAKRITFTQPGGAAVTLWGQGDEFYAVFETLDGYTVVFDQAQQAYCYARLSPDGAQLLSTGTQVQAGTGTALGLAPHLRISAAAIQQQVRERFAPWNAGLQVTERWAALKAQSHATAGQFAPPDSPTVGTKVGLCLLIEFTDDPATIPQADIADLCNGDDFTQFGNNGSVKKYFQDISNGLLTYSNVVTIYITVPKLKTFYNNTSKDCGTQGRLLIVDALNTMKALPNYATEILPLFDDLTVDNGNNVLALNVFYTGGNGNVWAAGLWPHSWSLASPVALSPGGKKVSKYQISNLGTEPKIGTFCHENGHLLCGYPDLYDYTGASAGVGDWCMMASGVFGGGEGNPSEVCAYLRRAAGWGTTTEVYGVSNFLATVSAAPSTNYNHFYRYQKPGVTTEYFLMECRSRDHRDSSLPTTGVAVWHVDELGDNSSVNLNPNSSHNNFEATLVQADNLWDLERNRNSGDIKDLYYLGNPATGYTNQLSDASKPAARWWNGTPSGLFLREFSARSNTMTFFVGAPPTVPVILGQPTNVTVVAGMMARFAVTVAGSEPLRFQWRKDGVVIPGATLNPFTIASAQGNDTAAYSVVVTNAVGTATSASATLTLIPTVPLPFALNNNVLTWTTDASYPWYGQMGVSHDGLASAHTGLIGDGMQTALRTTVTGPGTLSFWWRVSSEAEADTMSFSYDGQTQATVSGEIPWQQLQFYIPAGAQSLAWTYSKGTSGLDGQDAGWVDEVSYATGGTAPFLTLQPASQGGLPGGSVTLTSVANGTPPLAYQWKRNGVSVPGGTSPTLTLTNLTLAQQGNYAVVVANTYGSITSSSAGVVLVTIRAWGNNQFGQTDVPPTATNAAAVAGGGFHSLGLRADGRVIAWGNNYEGQCTVPATLTNAVAVAAGAYHSLALTAAGRVVAWGANYNGQTTVPANLTNVVAIAAGARHSLALRANGRVTGWGDASGNQLAMPANLTNAIAIAAAGNHSLALRSDGTVAAWGDNLNELGAYAGQSVVPAGLREMVAVAAGESHSLSVGLDGTPVLWGDASAGQLASPATPAVVKAQAGGGVHTIALTPDGSIAAWGANLYGQGSVPAGLTKALAVSAGSYHNLALLGTPPTVGPALSAPVRVGSQLRFSVPTQRGQVCILQYKTSLAEPAWQWHSAAVGDGSPRTFTDTPGSNSTRFYRVYFP